MWVKDSPARAKDAPHVRARDAKRGAIELADAKGTASMRYVIVTDR